MKTLILFNLKRRFFNKSTIVIMVLQFILIFFFLHLDIFENSNANTTIYLDNSVKKYHEYFGDLNSSLIYLIGNASGEEKIIIHLDEDKWSIYSKEIIDEDIKIQIENDIKTVMRKKYEDTHTFMKGYIAEYEDMYIEINEVVEQEESDEVLMILVSACYFLLVAYGNLISTEIVYQKNMKVLPVILNNIDIKEHFYAHIIYGYLVPLIRGGMFLVCLIPNLLIGSSSNNTLSDIALQNVELPEREIALSSIILTILLLLSLLVIVQILFLLVGSYFKDNDQISNFLLIVNIIGLLFYYLCLNNLTGSFLNKPIVVFLSYVPLLSSVLTSGRLLLDCCGILSGLFALSLNIVVIYLLVTRCLKIYKRNLLN